MSTLILAPSVAEPTDLTGSSQRPSSSSSSSSSTLHLLPFSLHPLPTNSLPKPISHFFNPRPAPPLYPGVSAGTPIASFRGRQVVGHSVHVPPRYVGVILSAPARGETSRSTERAVEGISNGKSKGTRFGDVSGVSHNGNGGVRSSARVKGAGQVALSKPRTRRQAHVVKQKINLDSDDDENDDQIVVAPPTRGRASLCSKVVALPLRPEEDDGGVEVRASKRARAETPVSNGSLSVPTINIVEATPSKSYPVPVTANTSSSSLTSFVDTDGELTTSESRTDMETSVDSSSSSSSSLAFVTPTTSMTSIESEPLIPSPATEDHPPMFSITTHTSTSPIVDQSLILEAEEMVDIDTRVLRPVKQFESFMLWTPDAAIPGFDARSDTTGKVLKADSEEEEAKEEKGDVKDGEFDEEERAAPSVLRPGWWRPGGSGEGGDDFVRALGEWLGIVEVINEVLYPEDEDDDEDDHE